MNSTTPTSTTTPLPPFTAGRRSLSARHTVPRDRLEAFSDGVFAIAITLLVLEIAIPDPGSGGFAHALAEQWPVNAADIVSFATIGIIWINHHAVMAT